MKHIYLLISFFIFSIAQAQIVNIPDANFKAALLNHELSTIDINGDGEIQVSEAESFSSYIIVNNREIQDLTGIEAFVNIDGLVCQDNLLTSLDVTQNTKLVWIECWDNQISAIDLSQNLELGAIMISRNLITELDVSVNVELTEIWADDNLITSLDVANLPLLDVLFFEGNMIETLDLSQNSLLTYFTCDYNGLTELILPETSILEYFVATNNNLTSLDFSNQSLLVGATLSNNPLTTLDFSSNPLIESLRLENMSQLTRLFIKNGTSLDPNSLFIENTENLEFICADQFEINQLNSELSSFGYSDVVVNSYCSFVPGGKVYVVQGVCRYDFNDNGCEDTDPVYPNLKYLVSDGTNSEYVYSDSNGNYYMPLQEGNFTITPIVENLTYFTMTPSSINIDLPTSNNPYIQDFCIVSDEIKYDLEIVIIPLEPARPGFDTDYRIIYKNKGNIMLSGSVEFSLENGNKTHFVSSFPAADNETFDQLSWNYSNLAPFEIRSIDVLVNINTPTDPNFPVNGGDNLGFIANIFPLSADETPSDNNFQLKQIVVNSFDPNDKTCLEGDNITPEMVGDYVHYMIRFENTGTANAINVVVKDMIDISKFDVSTLIPLHSNYNFKTRIKNTNEVEFIFENIDLPFDDANNDGFVIFKIKTLPTLVLGDSFSNDAEIYFDYNAAIITNDYLTTVEEALSVEESIAQGFKMYPNPVQNTLFIESENSIQSVTIYDMNGRLLNKVVFTGNALKENIDMKHLSQGIYFVKIKSDKGEVTAKILKK